MAVEGRFAHLLPGCFRDHLGDLETQRERNTLRDVFTHRGQNMHGEDLETQRSSIHLNHLHTPR